MRNEFYLRRVTLPRGWRWLEMSATSWRLMTPPQRLSRAVFAAVVAEADVAGPRAGATPGTGLGIGAAAGSLAARAGIQPAAQIC